MKYAHYDEKTGKILGWYDKKIHNTIPIPNIDVNDIEWQKVLDNSYNFYDTINKTFGYKDFFTEAEKAEFRKNEILFRLREIDILSIRPVRAIADNTAVQADFDKLKALNLEADNLRSELKTL